MKRQFLVLAALMVALLAAPASMAQAPDIVALSVTHADDSDATSGAIELVGNSESLTFAVQTVDDATSAQVELRHQCGSSSCETIQRILSATESDKKNWTGAISVAEKDIFEGTWNVTFIVANGGAVTTTETDDPLVFTADDDVAPTLSLVGGGTNARIGSSDGVRVNANDTTLQKVTYQIDGMTTQVELPDIPYRVDGSAFSEGTQNVVFRAYDRAGHVTLLPVSVNKDTTSPTVELVVPDVAYAHVPFAVTVIAADDSLHDLQVLFNGEALQKTALTGTGSHMFTLRTNDTGNASIAVTATDDRGNSANDFGAVNVTSATTSIEIVGVEIATPALPPLAGQTVTIRGELLQDRGVATLPFNVTTTVDDDEPQNFELYLDVNESVDYDIVSTFTAGLHRAHFAIAVPEYADNVGATDVNATLDFEVFLGRVLYDGAVYHIRVGANGLPAFAVGDNDTEYALVYDEDAETTRYAFEADGVALYWDPADQITTIEDESNVDGSEDSAPTPGFGILAAIALLGAVAVARARRE